MIIVDNLSLSDTVYRLSLSDTAYRTDSIDADEAFTEINKKYTKPGSLLKGIRIRKNLTQIEMAEKIEVTQSDISQMENGTRNIG